jgi:hypothetical protein
MLNEIFIYFKDMLTIGEINLYAVLVASVLASIIDHAFANCSPVTSISDSAVALTQNDFLAISFQC